MKTALNRIYKALTQILRTPKSENEFLSETKVRIPPLDQSPNIKLLINVLQQQLNVSYDFFKSISIILSKAGVDFSLSKKEYQGDISDPYRSKQIIFSIQTLLVHRIFEIINNQYSIGEEVASLDKELNEYIYKSPLESRIPFETELREVLLTEVQGRASLVSEEQIMLGFQSKSNYLDAISETKDRLLAEIERSRRVEEARSEEFKTDYQSKVKNKALRDLSDRPEEHKKILAEVRKAIKQSRCIQNGVTTR